MEKRYLNLFLHDTVSEESFKAKQAIIKHRYPSRENPIQHGKRLLQEFAQAKLFSDRVYSPEQVAAIKAKDGHYFDISGLKGKELVLKSLENVRSGIRICNVRTAGKDDDTEIIATVFIPNSKEHVFLKKLQDYAKGIPEGKDKPANNDLVKSIERISTSVVRSLWTDDIGLFPLQEKKWCEIWLRASKDNIKAIQDEFFATCKELNISVKNESLLFPDRLVLLALVCENDLQALLYRCGYLAEFRRGTELSSFFTNLTPSEQKEWTDELLSRTEKTDGDVSICILDTGANNEHPLLVPFFEDNSMHVARDYMRSVSDMTGHGTEMAGIAGYGDLLECLSQKESIQIHHTLESVKLLGNKANEPELYGDYTKRAIAIAEYAHPEKNRTICLAITAESTAKEKDGRPSSWSAELDALAAGVEDGTKRLILVSGGNVQLSEYNTDGQKYPDACLLHRVEDPAQAWNALTVGASSKLHTIDSPYLEGYNPLAAEDMLSPYSATSRLWSSKWPIKPEILCEGGNAAISEEGKVDTCDSLCVLTTHYRPTQKMFVTTNGTSPAVAKASWMAAQIMSMYPHCWPETVRALLVASARWTETMFDTFCKSRKKKDIQMLLRTCGYGVADLDRARYCVENSVNMIIESQIQPFEKRGNYCGYGKMHLHELPWPRDLLLSMGAETVEMRIVLSYFIEPGPGEIGFNDRYRYPCCGLRFDVNNQGESRDQFARRINIQMSEAQADNDIDIVSNDTGRWLIGEKGRTVGSLHCDIWKGTAAELSESNLVAVYPTTGWWRTRSYLNREDSTIRYALVITLSTPSIETKLYTEIANQVKVVTRVSV